jgi:hypothetical protein
MKVIEDLGYLKIIFNIIFSGLMVIFMEIPFLIYNVFKKYFKRNKLWKLSTDPEFIYGNIKKYNFKIDFYKIYFNEKEKKCKILTTIKEPITNEFIEIENEFKILNKQFKISLLKGLFKIEILFIFNYTIKEYYYSIQFLESNIKNYIEIEIIL